MSLSSLLHNIPLYQPVGIPPRKREIVILCPYEDIKYIPDTFSDYTVKLIISNIDQGQKIELDKYTLKIDYDFTKILNFQCCYIVIFCSKQDFSLLHWFYTKLEEIQIRHAYIYIPIQRDLSNVTNYNPTFIDQHRDELEKVYELLDDDESRMIFASRIKSIILGDIGYIKQSDYAQYFHPLTIPQRDDIILDGGVSGNISVEQKFSELVGDNGHIYSFEPEPGCYFQANDKIADIKNMTLFQYGLWDKCEQVHFSSEGAGSHVVDNNKNSVTCHMTTIDNIVSQYNIKKVDMIKLDVEGSEEKSLLGGIKTIVKHRPKLLISLYHKHNDIFELPLFINKLDLDYTFYLGHHRPSLQETVLYVVPCSH
jgi:FkbM family methyltransferase